MASSLKPGDLFEIKIVKLKNAGDFRAKSLDKEVHPNKALLHQ